ncbi:MAG: type II secretion system protein [Candidatus Moraniibacteriota bacterium]
MRNIKNEGFTLIEMIIAVAVLAIVSGAILVSISGQKEKAESNRILTEASATVQPIMMCLSDGGSVNSPNSNGGNNICNISPEYGQWPETSSSDFSYGSSSFPAGGDWSFEVSDGNYDINCSNDLNGCEKN